MYCMSNYYCLFIYDKAYCNWTEDDRSNKILIYVIYDCNNGSKHHMND